VNSMPDNNSGSRSSEKEMLDVVITLDVSGPDEIPLIVAELQKGGLSVVKVDQANGVVEGTLAAEKLVSIRRTRGVSYVRNRFEYMASPSSSEPKKTE
jgi:hypothetical protein